MKKVRKIIYLTIAISVILLCFSSCGKLHMDEEKCAEVALEYMKNKYGKEFVLIDSSESMSISGPVGYAEVEVKTTESEESYWVSVYPDGKSDKDKDGFYDSYKAISDDYMSHLLNESVKKEVDKLFIKVGLTRFISRIGIEQVKDTVGFRGFLSDFDISNVGNLSLREMLKQYKIILSCYIDIPESEYSETLEDKITESFYPLLHDDLIKFDIDVYDDEKYNEFEEQIKSGESYLGGLGTKSIYFSIKDKED